MAKKEQPLEKETKTKKSNTKLNSSKVQQTETAQAQAKVKQPLISTKRKIGIAIYFTFLATLALVMGAQILLVDVFDSPEMSSNGTLNTQQQTTTEIEQSQNNNPVSPSVDLTNTTNQSNNTSNLINNNENTLNNQNLNNSIAQQAPNEYTNPEITTPIENADNNNSLDNDCSDGNCIIEPNCENGNCDYGIICENGVCTPIQNNNYTNQNNTNLNICPNCE